MSNQESIPWSICFVTWGMVLLLRASTLDRNRTEQVDYCDWYSHTVWIHTVVKGTDDKPLFMIVYLYQYVCAYILVCMYALVCLCLVWVNLWKYLICFFFIPPIYKVHDDVIQLKHFPRYWPFVREIHRSPVNFPHKGQWRGALMFSLIYA